MLLELGKTVSFVVCIVSLYSVLMSSFFELATTWQQRLGMGLARLALAGCVSFASGLLFSLPARSNDGSVEGSRDRGVSVWRTLPVRLFLWSAMGLAVLFCAAWFLRCGGVNSYDVKADCF